jgi:hypothetical protein
LKLNDRFSFLQFIFEFQVLFFELRHTLCQRFFFDFLAATFLRLQRLQEAFFPLAAPTRSNLRNKDLHDEEGGHLPGFRATVDPCKDAQFVFGCKIAAAFFPNNLGVGWSNHLHPGFLKLWNSSWWDLGYLFHSRYPYPPYTKFSRGRVSSTLTQRGGQYHRRARPSVLHGWYRFFKAGRLTQRSVDAPHLRLARPPFHAAPGVPVARRERSEQDADAHPGDVGGVYVLEGFAGSVDRLVQRGPDDLQAGAHA